MANFTNNFFGSIAGIGNGVRGGPYGFIPKNNNDGIISLVGKDATWLGLRSRQMQYWSYIYCAPLASVIDRLAECDVNGKLEIIKDDDTETESKSETTKRIMRLLKRPNPLQTWKQFRAQQIVYKKVFGFCPVFPVSPAGFSSDPSYATSIWNLAPWLCFISPTNKYWYQTDYKDVVKELRITMLGDTITLTGDQFFTLDDGIMPDEWNGYLTPLSKVAGLDWAISNILAAMEADNVLLRKKGPIGMWTNAAPVPGQQAAYLPMKPSEKEELRADLMAYGLSWDQFQHMVSRNHVKYESAGYNIKDLMTKETAKQGIEAICDRFGYDIQLLSNKDGPKFDNKDAMEKSIYQNNVIPNSDADMEEYNRWFKQEELGTCIRQTFDHLQILQEDSLKEGQSLQSKTTALQLQYKDDVITLGEYRVALGYEPGEDADLYYSQSQQAQAAVKDAKQITNASEAN